MDKPETKLLTHSGSNLLHQIQMCEVVFDRQGQEHIMQLHLNGKIGTYVLTNREPQVSRGGTRRNIDVEDSLGVKHAVAAAFGLFLYGWLVPTSTLIEDTNWISDYRDSANSLLNYAETGEGLNVTTRLVAPYARNLEGTLASFNYIDTHTERLVKLGTKAPKAPGTLGTGLGVKWTMNGRNWQDPRSYSVQLYNTSFGDGNLVRPPPESDSVSLLYKKAVIEQTIVMKDLGMFSVDSTNGIAAVLNLKLPPHTGLFHHDPMGVSYEVRQANGMTMTNMNEVRRGWFATLMQLIGLGEPRRVDEDVANTIISFAYRAGDDPAVFASDSDLESGTANPLRPRDKSVTFADQSRVSHAGSTMLAPGLRETLVVISRPAKEGEEVNFIPAEWEPHVVERRDSNVRGGKQTRCSIRRTKRALRRTRAKRTRF